MDNLVYQNIKPQHFSENLVTFVIEPVSQDARLRRSVLIKWTVEFEADDIADIADMFEGRDIEDDLGDPLFSQGDVPVPSAVNDNRIALRQGFPITSAAKSISLRINNLDFKYYPFDYAHQMMRFYATESEIKHLCSMSGGPFDSGNHSLTVLDDAFTSTAPVEVNDMIPGSRLVVQHLTGYNVLNTKDEEEDVTATLIDLFPTTTDNWYNPGLTKRFHNFARESRLQGDPPNEEPEAVFSRYGDKVVMEVYERIPIPPFQSWYLRDGNSPIPNIRKMTLTMEFDDEWVQRAVQYSTNNFVLSIATEAPELHLEWEIGHQSVPKAPVSFVEMRPLLFNGPRFELLNTEFFKTASFSQRFRIDELPDLLMIYCKPEKAFHLPTYPAERHIEMTSLSIAMGGVSGKLLEMSSGQMFQSYIRNCPAKDNRDFDFHEWRKNYCTLALRPADYGLTNRGKWLDIHMQIELKAHRMVYNVGLQDFDQRYQEFPLPTVVHWLPVYNATLNMTKNQVSVFRSGFRQF